ncbi:MAG: DNA repair protein RecN [Magnetococcales bacterium]|nr:DNA repair protein RecN [Magnetococcales bacterium]
MKGRLKRMLRQLTIENIALVERLDLEFGPGLTILTGETGAGKSILIDALALTLGARADSGLIRTGCDQAMATARFLLPDHHPARLWLREQELNGDGEELFLRRTLSANGRSKAFINETPVPITTLAQLGDGLVDIHGQHDHQSLLNPASHLTILDAFACHDELVRLTASHAQAWQTRHKALEALRQRARDALQRRAFLAHQLDEIDAAGIQRGEFQELEQRRGRLAHAVRLGEAATRAMAQISGERGESEDSASRLLSWAAGELEDAARLDPALTPLAEQLRSLQYELEDAGERIRHYADSLETDPEQLEALEERLALIRNLARKHRQSADELLELAETWRAELTSLDQIDDDEQRLLTAMEASRRDFDHSAARLSASRKQATQRLTLETESHLSQLGMNARFATSLRPVRGDPRSTGLEEAEFQISANPGEPLKPLKQVASGGEIARIMLALKTALADAVTVPTLIFDEVDVGVGGRTAAAIGAKLAQVAQRRQTLAVTHSPQVASWGTRHFKVAKATHEGRVRVTVIPLEEEHRIEELARMLAGEEITPAARENALALLRAAIPETP